jgi:hypothetical protein
MFLTPRQDGTDGIVVKAIAFAAHMSPSPVAESAPYEFEAFKPVADPNGGRFDSSVQVKLTCATEMQSCATLWMGVFRRRLRPCTAVRW